MRTSVRATLRILPVLLLISLTAARVFADEPAVTDEQKGISSANSAFASGDWDGAIAQVADLLNKFPNSPIRDEELLLLGESQFKKNHFAESKTPLRELLEKYPASAYRVPASFRLATDYFELGEIDQAETIFEELLEEKVELQKVRDIENYLIEIKEKKEEWPEAVDLVLHRIGTENDPAEIERDRNKIASLIQNKMDKRSLRSVIAKDPRSFPSDLAYLQLLNLYETEKDLYHFEKAGRRFLELFPKNEFADTLRQKLKALNEQVRRRKFSVGVILPSAKQMEEFNEEVVNGVNLALWDFQKGSGEESTGVVFRELPVQNGKLPAETEGFLREFSPRAVIGPLLTRDFEAISGVAETFSVPFITPTATRSAAGLRSKFLFRTGLTGVQQAREMADYGATRGGMKRVVILYPQTAYGEELSKSFGEEAARLGVEIIARQGYSPDATDFSPEIRNIIKTDLAKYGVEGEKVDEKDFKHHVKREYKPGFDSIYLPGEGLKSGLIPSQLAFYDVTAVSLYGSNGWNTPEFLKAGGKYLEGGTFPDGFFLDSASPQVADFVARYRKEFQEDPTIFAAQSYDAMMMVLQARKKGASSGLEVRNALASEKSYEGVSGTYRAGLTGELEKKPFILQIKNGKLHEVNQAQ